MKHFVTSSIVFITFLIFSNSIAQINSIDLDDLQYSRKEYYKSRGVLYAADSLLKDGFDVELNSKEMKLNSHLTSLQKDYIKHSGPMFAPANYFYKYRNMIDTSEIYKKIQRMPKGALLHIHSTAMGDAEWLVKNASYREHCYFYNKENDLNNVYGSMYFYEDGKAPADWVPIKNLRAADPDFDNKLLKLLTFSAADENSPVIWEDFEKIFTRMGGLIEYLPVFKDYLTDALTILLKDKVQHVEVRTSLHGLYDLEGKYYSYVEYAQVHSAVINELKAKYPQLTTKIIFAGWRGNSPEGVMNYINIAFDVKKAFPQLLTGFDLVGEEDAGHRTDYFLNEFFKKDSLEDVYDLKLPFYFHDGESTLPIDNNLYDAFLLRSKRIGHGINLFRFPTLEQIARDEKIPIEVCPLSNQILGYVANLRMHPASGYLNKGIPITISSDDPQIFNYRGLSYDFWTAYMAWELDLRQLKKFALNSLVYSALEEKEKDEAIKYFLDEWDKWVNLELK